MVETQRAEKMDSVQWQACGETKAIGKEKGQLASLFPNFSTSLSNYLARHAGCKEKYYDENTVTPHFFLTF